MTALFMKNWDEDDSDGHCSAAEDLADAERVCEALDVPLSLRLRLATNEVAGDLRRMKGRLMRKLG